MSPTDVRHGRSPPDTDERLPPPVRQKSVLFCPDCAHESVPDGDWREDDDVVAGVRRLRCPECETVLTERPLPEDSLAVSEKEPAFAATVGFEAWADLLTSTVRFWFQWPGRDEGSC